MNEKYWKAFLLIFAVVCWSSTISSIFYWIYLFSLNEDLTVLDYKRYYYDNSSAYPTLSLCFQTPFNKTKLEHTTTNVESYLEFLKGNNYSSQMWEHNYEDVVFDISQHVLGYWIEFRNGSSKEYSPTSDNLTLFSTTFSGFWREGFYNCYGIQIMNDVEMQWLSVLMKGDIFPSKIRPEKYGFFILLHYPNQLLRSTNTIKYMWPKRKTNDTYEMKFQVKGTEMIKHRYKSRHPCNQDWERHGMTVQIRHSQTVGCVAPYQNQDAKLRPCSTKYEIEKAWFALRYDEYGNAPPCTSMEKIKYSYEELDLSNTKWSGTGNIWIGIHHQNRNFKNIAQIR